MSGRAGARLGLVLGLLALPSAKAAPGETFAEAEVGAYRIAVPVPGGSVATPVPRGVALRPPGARRSPLDMVVTLEATPAAGLTRTRREGGVTMLYRLDREEGGSGGEETTLVAERPCAGALLRLVLRAQTEGPGTPPLGPAWAVLRDALCRRVEN